MVYDVVQLANLGIRLEFVIFSLGDWFCTVEIPKSRWHQLHWLVRYNKRKRLVRAWITA